MAPNVAEARKAVVASVGAAVLVLGGLGLDQYASASDEVIVLFDAVVGLLTAAGVFVVPND